MSREAAKALLTRQIGEPDTRYISPGDLQAVIDILYTDLLPAGTIDGGTP